MGASPDHRGLPVGWARPEEFEPPGIHAEEEAPGWHHRAGRLLLNRHRRAAIRLFCLETPVLDRLYIAFNRTARERSVTRATDIVIEGYPRSANTRAVVAFQVANGAGHRIASHLHIARSIEQAVRLGKPTILIVREPLGVLRSFRTFAMLTEAANFLDHYADFHERVFPYLDQVVVARFEDVVEHYGSVILRVNEKFGTNFAAFGGTPEEEAEVARRLEVAATLRAPGRPTEVVGKPVRGRHTNPDAASLTEEERRALLRAEEAYAKVIGSVS